MNKVHLSLGFALALCGCHATTAVSGTWMGRFTGPGSNSIGFKFEVVEENGAITGLSYVEDSVTKIYDQDAPLSGSRSGDEVTWVEVTGGLFKGKLVDGKIIGTYTFRPDPELPAHLANKNLARDLVLTR
jgi:hypothetical protein